MKKIILLLMSFTLCKSQNLQWLNSTGSTSNDVSNEVKTDATGNIYTVGNFLGTVDFDPGVGVANLVGGATISGFVAKTSSAGAYIWAKPFLGVGASNVKSVDTDASGNVYVTGLFNGTVDFDPGAGTFTMMTTSLTDEDVFIVKLSSTGTFVWAKQIGNIYDDGGKSIVVDGAGDVIIGGECSGGPTSSNIDLNPGAAVNNFLFNVVDPFLLKLDNAGNYIQARCIGGAGTDLVCKVKVDATNNVYFGGYFDFALGTLGIGTVPSCGYLAKVNSSFTNVWAIAFNGDNLSSVLDFDVDGSGNVYATGWFRGSTDFDGGAASYSLTSQAASDYDVFVTKVNSTGGFLWADKIAAGVGNASGNGISLDILNNVFVTGYFSGTVDFNPTAAVFNKTSAGSNDVFVCKLDANGNFSNDAQAYGNTGSDVSNGIQCVGTGNYIITGYYAGSVDFSSSITSNSITSNGGSDIFVAKYTACTVPPLTTALSPTLMNVCANTTTILSVNTSTGVTYSWFNVGGGGTTLGSGSTFTTPVLTSTISFWAEGTNTCGATARVQFSINVAPSPTVNIATSSSSVCSGSTATLTASGASTYTWSTGATTTVIAVSPTILTVYTATGTSVSGCKDTQTLSLSVIANPTVNITASTPSLCSGSSATLTASGASTYSWSTGATTTVVSVSPTITTIYTATGTAVSGCKDTQTLSINVSANPTVNISASSPSICSGSNATFTASGASTYSWSSGATTTVVSVSPTITTVYTATGTAVSGCKDTQTISLAVTTTPTLVTNNYTICAGGTATLTSSGATTYSWNTGATTTSITVTPTSNITYTVTGFNGTCTDVNTVSVTVGSALSIAITPSVPSICIGNSGTLTASGATSYTWTSGPTTSSIVVTPTITTNYTVNGTNGTCAGTKTITMVVNPNPTVVATSSSSVICTGNSATLNASGANTYNWNPGSLSGTSVTVSPTLTTTYSVTGTSTAGCTNTKTVSITVSACTGIQDLANENGFLIYPNPTSSKISISFFDFGNEVKIELIDLTGKILQTNLTVEEKMEIDISGLNNGMYFVKIKSSQKEVIKKIIKQ